MSFHISREAQEALIRALEDLIFMLFDVSESPEEARLAGKIKDALDEYKKECVWANEIDKYACQTYRKNFGEKELRR